MSVFEAFVGFICAVIDWGRGYLDSAVRKFVFFVDEGKMLTVMSYTPPPPFTHHRHALSVLCRCAQTQMGDGAFVIEFVCVHVCCTFPPPLLSPRATPTHPQHTDTQTAEEIVHSLDCWLRWQRRMGGWLSALPRKEERRQKEEGGGRGGFFENRGGQTGEVRRFRVEVRGGRLGGWRRGWVVSEPRRAAAGRTAAQVQPTTWDAFSQTDITIPPKSTTLGTTFWKYAHTSSAPCVQVTSVNEKYSMFKTLTVMRSYAHF